MTNAMAAVAKVHSADKVCFESMNLDQLRKKKWTIKQFVDWLLGSHIHFVIAHVHQGTEQFGWSTTSIYSELQRLKLHPGFPRLDYLACPIFTQDKMRYLLALEGRTMRSFQIPVSSDMDMNATEQYIER
jgi:hypothetical protein